MHIGFMAANSSFSDHNFSFKTSFLYFHGVHRQVFSGAGKLHQVSEKATRLGF